MPVHQFFRAREMRLRNAMMALSELVRYSRLRSAIVPNRLILRDREVLRDDRPDAGVADFAF